MQPAGIRRATKMLPRPRRVSL